MRNRKWIALLLAGVMALSLAACGGSGEETAQTEPAQEAEAKEAESESAEAQEEQTEAPSGEKIEITGMVQQSRWYSGLQNMVDQLAEKENIYIEFEVIPDDQYDNLMKMRLNSHEAPDLVVYQFADLFVGVNPEEFFVALDDEAWMSKVQAPELTEYNGKHYGYCLEASNGFQGLIYNKDVFEANGIEELPKTLDEFYAVCDQLKAADIVPIAIPSDTWVPQIWMTSGMSRALGTVEACEDFADKILTNQAKFNDYPEMAAVVDEYLDLFEKGYVNEDFMTVSYDEILGRLASGEIAMIYGATEILTSIEESYPDANLTIFNPPVGYDDRDVLAYLPTAMGIAVNKDTENLDTIKKVFDLWSTPEYGDLYFQSRPGFPNIEGIDGNEGAMNPDIPKIYNEYMSEGRVVAQMNQYIDTLQPLFGNTLWVYFLEAPSKGNMDGAAVMERFQGDVDKFMKEKGAEGWN